VQPAPEFEEFDPGIAAAAPPRAKAIAFYLTQFHSIAENDEWWGGGFTEWTNVARGLPRFTGHYQPRVPRDLGFYNLEHDGILARQVELARAAGIHGFSFYYYWFDGKRLLERPLERFLADRSIDFPFCLMWANENWTRRWDGAEEELLMQQTYDPELDVDLIDDLQRHVADDRYIRIDGRPLLMVYRTDIIPDLRESVDRWREIWKVRHGEDPFLLAAQTFGNSEDPRQYGFDGAYEFPPHGAGQNGGWLNVSGQLDLLDPSFSAGVLDYRVALEESLSRPHPDFPLVKTILPSWDNDARLQGQGLMLHGSTPKHYENWLRGVADIATAHPVGGESLVFINAWNEWAEGAYLEPDVHFGSAYLNATARALCSSHASESDVQSGDFAADLRQALAAHVPQTALTAVATGGDEWLLSLPDCETCHFPRAFDGDDGLSEASGETALIANLEALRAAGVDFLFVPAGQRWLLERNALFRAHLGDYARVLDSEELGTCFRLDAPDPSKAWRRQLVELAESVERETGREASILDWNSGLPLLDELPACSVFTSTEPQLPHLDGSVDIVALVTSSDERLTEAKRVARYAVLEVPADGAPPGLVVSASFVEQTPTASIVIPCHEQLARTHACIRALAETLPSWFLGEIIIVDDASGPDTVAGLEELVASDSRVTLLRNEVNLGFLASVNRAVGESIGEFVVLLNNDTIPLPGWLPPLLAPFGARDDVGAVGGRLIYPDGRLQEAGGLVFRDGSAAKFGYGDPEPDFPLFTVPREVDYCSGCLLAFRREFFVESGAFDPEYGFGFYEDTDFCFRVRSLGKVVFYEPESVIVHVEGASAGTDLTQGAKQFQALNASLFMERWQEALARQPERPERLDREDLQRLSRRTAAFESP
jgi:GT2 family glycosyltransferase